MEKGIIIFMFVIFALMLFVVFAVKELKDHMEAVKRRMEDVYSASVRCRDSVQELDHKFWKYELERVREQKKEEREIKNAHVMRDKKELDNMLNHIPKDLYEYCGRECRLGQYRHKYIIKCDCRAQLIADVRGIICDRGVEWSECYTPKDKEFVVSIYEVD